MKFIKQGLYGVLGLFVIALVAATVFLVTFDANDYKETISEQVEAQTGRQFALQNIKPSVFPWLGVELHSLSLSNANGFNASHQLEIERLDVRVELLPLLKQEIRIGTLRVHGLQLNLEKNKQGIHNWDDLLQKKTEQASSVAAIESEKNSASAPALALRINSIDIKDANIHWLDATTATNVSLSAVNIQTGEVILGEALDLELSAFIALSEPAVRVQLSMETTLEFNPQTEQLVIPLLKVEIDAALERADVKRIQLTLDTKLNADLQKQQFAIPEYALNMVLDGEAISAKQLQVDMGGRINVDMKKQHAELNDMHVNIFGLKIKTKINLKRFIDAPHASGSLSIEEFNLNSLANKLDVSLPPMQSRQALKKVALSFEFSGHEDAVWLNSILLTLDQSTIKSRLTVSDFSKPEINYSINMDTITLDDYLPPEKKETSVPKKLNKVQKSDEDTLLELPVALIRSLDIKGDFTLGEARILKQIVSNVVIKLQAKKGQVNVTTLNATVLQGQLKASAQLDVRKNTPRYAFKLQGKGFKAAEIVDPMLQDLLGKQSVGMSGMTSINANISSKGHSVKQIINNSNGQFKLNMSNAALRGIDAEYFVRQAVIEFLEKKKQAVPNDWRGEYKPKERTALKVARASAIIRNGVITNQDLLLKAPRFNISGAGTINLPREKLNYRLVVDVQPASKKTTAEKILDIPMPIFVKGSFANPAISIDSKAWTKSIGKELKTQAKKEIKKALEKEKDKLKDKLKDKFKRFFR